MKSSEYLKVKEMTTKLIAFIRWRGADFSSKEKKVIKELSLIEQFCKENIESPDTPKEKDKP